MITENLLLIRNELLPDVKLIAVSKTQPLSSILEAYEAGQRCFGENKVQELVGKYEALPKDIEWHMIGHLQRNKVKYIAPFVSLIHGVESLSLLQEINKQAAKQRRIIDCLLQFHIAQEDTKFGLDLDEAIALLKSDSFLTMQHIRICGVMGMASFTDNENQVRNEFNQLKELFTKLKEDFFANEESFKEISMGMSGDYQLAMSCGSTMIRIGSKIFGERSYS